MLYISAYEEKLNDDWQQTREISYMIYCTVAESKNRLNIFEFLPLPGDPSSEDLKQLKKGKVKERMERTIKMMERMRNGQ